jgi:hypothetical protein
MMKLKVMVIVTILAVMVGFAANAKDKAQEPKGFFERIGVTVDTKVDAATTSAKRTAKAAGDKVNYVCTKSRQTVGKGIRTAGEKLYMFGQKLG